MHKLQAVWLLVPTNAFTHSHTSDANQNIFCLSVLTSTYSCWVWCDCRRFLLEYSVLPPVLNTPKLGHALLADLVFNILTLAAVVSLLHQSLVYCLYRTAGTARRKGRGLCGGHRGHGSWWLRPWRLTRLHLLESLTDTLFEAFCRSHRFAWGDNLAGYRSFWYRWTVHLWYRWTVHLWGRWTVHLWGRWSVWCLLGRGNCN